MIMAAQRARSAHSRAEPKPMTSPVNWALLGLVIERPDYGYRLRQRFDDVYRDVLSISSESHVYTGLNMLEGRDLIERDPEAPVVQSGTDRQPKPRYRATPKGLRSYRERMLAQAQDDRRHSRLFIRQLALFRREPEVALEILEHLRSACLEEASRTPIPTTSAGIGEASGLAERLATEDSRLAMEAKLPWIDYARREFQALVGKDRPR
jgi:DNA-binding PadR family transcriptional regulator